MSASQAALDPKIMPADEVEAWDVAMIYGLHFYVHARFK